MRPSIYPFYSFLLIARTTFKIIPMSHLFKIAYALLFLFSALPTKSQSLGNYPNTSVISGQNVMITPDALPTSTTSIVAYTNTNFSGILTVNPVTGILQVTNAKHAGTYLVTVKAFGALPSTKTFTLTINNPECSQGQFIEGYDVVSDTVFRAFAIGDFNGDGKHDMAVGTYFDDHNVSVRLGDGNGGFAEVAKVKVGNIPRSIVIGDFNGDGKQDFAMTNTGSVYISIGDGLGNFEPEKTVVTVAGSIGSLIIGDFNNDGKKDIAVINGYVSILLGDGNGGFTVNTLSNFGRYSNAITIGDFNKDGKQDLASVIRYSLDSNVVTIGLGDGNGGFIESSKVKVGRQPNSIVLGDFNGDGNQDLAIDLIQLLISYWGMA